MKKELKIILFTPLILVIIILIFVRVMGYKRVGDYMGEETIKIGVSLPLTYGGVSFFAKGALGGLKLAQKEINERGGILGKEIELIIEDDGCEDKEKAIEVWDKLINIDKVWAILGPICTKVAEEVFPNAQISGVSVIMGGDSVPSLSRFGDYIFNAYPTNILLGKFSADYIFNELNKKRVAILYKKEKDGDEESFIDFFVERFERYKEIGSKIVFNEPFLVNSKEELINDISGEEIIKSKIDKIKESKAEVILFSLARDDGYEVMIAIREANLDVIVFGPEVILSYPEFEGALYSSPKVNNPQEFQNKIDEVYKESISFITPIYYDVLYILSQAIERAGKLDRKLIRDELAKTSYKGIAFPVVEFDEYGDLKEAEFEVKIIKNGKSEVYIIEE